MKNKFSVKKIKDFKQYRKFLLTQDYQLYVQTPEYGEFYKSMGHDYFILGIYNHSKLVSASLVLQVRARRGHFYFLPYGPNLDFKDPALLAFFKKSIMQYAKRNKVDFVRICPFYPSCDTVLENLKQQGFKKSPMHMLAETTWLLDLKPDLQQLLADMKQNHRNLIRRQQKLEIKVQRSYNVKDIKKVHDLLATTSQRHNFVPFSLKYLENEFKCMSKLKLATIYLGYYQDELVAAAITFAYGNTMAYKHGASNMRYKKIPVSYAIQWQAIQDAKARGCKYYNFWGVAPETAPKSHPFYGITHFKKGFSGRQIDLIPAFDIKVSYRYYINLLVEIFRKYKRGFN